VGGEGGAVMPSSALGKPGRTAGYRPQRMRVHETCLQAGDEMLGYSAPPSGTRCARCKELLNGAATVVQRFPRDNRSFPTEIVLTQGPLTSSDNELH
jgi:hypothetical protein